MNYVSPAFMEAIYAPLRRVTGIITLRVANVGALDAVTASATLGAPISNLDQVLESYKRMTANFATFEPNHFKLDGSFMLPPENPSSSLIAGWWSENLSNATGQFDTPTYLQFDFSEVQDSIGLSITFNPNGKEYSDQFDIEYYNGSGQLIVTESVVNNDRYSFVSSQGVLGFYKIRIVFKHTPEPYRRVRVLAVDFGITYAYTDDEIVDATLLEEKSHLVDFIASTELSFSLDNSKKVFNITNPAGMYAFLQEKQIIEFDMEVELANGSTELVLLGKYFLKDWVSEEGALTASFTAYDSIYFIGDYVNDVGVPGTLYALIEALLIKCGVDVYDIDVSLQNYSTEGFVREHPANVALRMLAQAGMCNVMQDRSGVLRIKPEATGSVVDHITLDNSYAVPKVKLNDAIKTLTVVGRISGAETEWSYNNALVEKGRMYRLDNELINTVGHANTIANWFIGQLNKRRTYEVYWRQNPALQIGDTVTIEDMFKATSNGDITRQKLVYRGYLDGESSVQGV